MCVCVCAKSLRRVRRFVTPWTAARQAHASWDSPARTLAWAALPPPGGPPDLGRTIRVLRLLHWRRPGPRFPSRPNLRVGTPVPVPLSWVDAGFPGEGVGFRVCSFPERVVQGWLAWRILQRVPVALLTHTPQQDLGQLPGYCLGTQRSRGAAVNLFGIIHSFICSSSKYFSAITLSSLFEDSLKIFTPMMKILQLMTKKNKIWYTKILETFKKQITWCPSNAALLPLYSGTLNMFWTWNF